MKCPLDGTNLALSSREGIEIDYCPECRGVWLDRGELDKLVERSSSTTLSSREQYREESNHDSRSNEYKKRRKRENFLGELFDF